MKARLFSSVIFMCLAVAGVGAQLGQRDTRVPQPSGTGRIAGTVTAAESGQAVRLAQVQLMSSSGERSTVTDEGGAFAFDNLPPGSYTLSVSKSGYLNTEYGQVRPGTDTRGRSIVLKEGEQLTRLAVPISQGGSISGVVKDERGEPIYRATVRASRLTLMDGSRTLVEVESIETDERGGYRLPLLPSRQYIVSALPPGDAIPEDVSKSLRVGYAPVFHPGVAAANPAEAIALGIGEHRSGVDLVMPLVRLSTVSGTVVGPDGQPAPHYSVTLRHSSTEDSATTDEHGRFTFERVGPGNYTLMAGRDSEFFALDTKVKILRDTGGGSYSFSVGSGMLRATDFTIEYAAEKESPPPPRLGTAMTDITVSGTPIDLTLRLDPPRVVAGRVVLEGAQPRPPLNTIEVALQPIGADWGSFSAKIAADGTFTLPNVAPGRYVVTAVSPQSEWTLASATAGGMETLDTHLDIARDRDVRDLTLTFRDRRTELGGTVLDSSPNPATDRIVIVFPTDERLWIYGSNRILSAAVGEGGRYSFVGLRPGTYRLAVVTGAEPDEWLQPEFLQQLLGASIPITIVDGEKKTQDLRVK